MITKKNKLIIIGFILAAVVLGIVAALMLHNGHSLFVLDKVELNISCPEASASGDEIHYKIKYANNTKVVLKNAEIIFQYPEGFFLNSAEQNNEAPVIKWNLGDIQPGFQDSIYVAGILAGKNESVKEASAVLKFRPTNFNSLFEKKSKAKTKIDFVPVTLTVESPEKISVGQTFEYVFNFKNVSEKNFENLRIELKYPDGFTFEESNFEPIETDSNIWEIEKIKHGEESELKIKGVLAGKENQEKFFQGIWGQEISEKFIQFGCADFEVKISLPLIEFKHTVNGFENYNVSPGDDLFYKIKYKNVGEKDIKDLTIVLKPNGSFLELDTLESDEGLFDGGKIVWSGFLISRLALLKSGNEGEVNFRIKMKNELPIENSSSKNFTLENLIKAEGFISDKGDKMSVSGILANKINSRLVISQKGYYNDDGRISNFGPIPPQVGKKTTYTIHWQILNLANDLEKVEIQGTIPSWVGWEEKVISENSDFHFDAKTGKIIWNVGNLPANTGIFSPAKEVVFQISIIPETSQVGDFVMLASEVIASGFDTFTGEDLMSTSDALTTILPDDLSIGEEERRVIE